MRQTDDVRTRYQRAGVAVYGVLRRREPILEMTRELADPRVTAAWSRLLDQWVRSYREARSLWTRRLSDGSPSPGSREAAASLLEQTAASMRTALEGLSRQVSRVPAALRVAQRLGLRPAIDSLAAVSEGAATVARVGAAALPIALALAAALLLSSTSRHR